MKLAVYLFLHSSVLAQPNLPRCETNADCAASAFGNAYDGGCCEEMEVVRVAENSKWG
jgi:hypothetical protein